MVVTDENVEQAFEQLWHAQRELSRAEYQQHLAQLKLDAAINESEAARDAVMRTTERLQQLAAKSAGIDDAPPDDSAIPRHDGFRPIQRR